MLRFCFLSKIIHSLITIQSKKKQQKQRENVIGKQCKKKYNHCRLGLHKSSLFPTIHKSSPFLKSTVFIF